MCCEFAINFIIKIVIFTQFYTRQKSEKVACRRGGGYKLSNAKRSFCCVVFPKYSSCGPELSQSCFKRVASLSQSCLRIVSKLTKTVTRLYQYISLVCCSCNVDQSVDYSLFFIHHFIPVIRV